MKIKTMAEYFSEGKSPEILFWVGDAASFDTRAKKIALSFCKILQKAGVDFAILGKEEKSTGETAKRVGNEFLFQMMALANIETLNAYQIKRIVTTCPHCFNTLKNEYPALGGNYEVFHHTQFIQKLLKEGLIKIKNLSHEKITFHDPCYLGRAHGEYDAPREILQSTGVNLVEMKRCKSQALCCGAGGGQFFKESEKGNQEINILRTEEALKTNARIIATGCPFCCIMLTDGLKYLNKNNEIQVKDIAEIIVKQL